MRMLSPELRVYAIRCVCCPRNCRCVYCHRNQGKEGGREACCASGACERLASVLLGAALHFFEELDVAGAGEALDLVLGDLLEGAAADFGREQLLVGLVDAP